MVVVAVVAHAIVPGHELGGGVRARRDRRADRPRLRPGDVLPPRRPGADADARRGRVDDQRRDRARRLPRRAGRAHRGRVLVRRRRCSSSWSARPAARRSAWPSASCSTPRHPRARPTTRSGILLSVLNAYAGYIVAEEAARLRRARRRRRRHLLRLVRAHRRSTPAPGSRAVAFWRVMVLGLEAMLFILLGLQAPQLAEEIDVAPLVGQARRRRPRRRRGADGLRDRPAGRVRRHLARARRGGLGGHARRDLARRRALDPARASTERPEILLITFGVIFVTLLGQGLTLAPLLRKLDLRGERALVARRGDRPAGDRAGGARPARGARGGGRATGEPVRRLRELYRGALRALRRRARRRRAARGRPARAQREYGAMRRELIAAERATLLGAAQRAGSIRHDARAQGRARPRPRRGADPSAVGCAGDDRAARRRARGATAWPRSPSPTTACSTRGIPDPQLGTEPPGAESRRSARTRARTSSPPPPAATSAAACARSSCSR